MLRSPIRGHHFASDQRCFGMLTEGIDYDPCPFGCGGVIGVQECHQISLGGTNSDIAASRDVMRTVPRYRDLSWDEYPETMDNVSSVESSSTMMT